MSSQETLFGESNAKKQTNKHKTVLRPQRIIIVNARQKVIVNNRAMCNLQIPDLKHIFYYLGVKKQNIAGAGTAIGLLK